MSGARLFTDYLRELDKGRFLTELSSEMQALVEAIAETGKKGSITVKLDLSPSSHDAETVTVSPTFKTVLPKATPGATLYFMTEERNLSRRDPRQGDIEDTLHEVKNGAPAQA